MQHKLFTIAFSAKTILNQTKLIVFANEPANKFLKTILATSNLQLKPLDNYRFPELLYPFWTLQKIDVLAKASIKCWPFVHYDTDLIVYDVLTVSSQANRKSIICQNLESLNVYDIGLQILSDNNILLPYFVDPATNTQAMNCGIIGGGPLGIFDEFANELCCWLNKNLSVLITLVHRQELNFIFEQYFLFHFLQFRKVAVIPVVPNVISGEKFFNFVEFSNYGMQDVHPFYHVMNAKNNLPLLEQIRGLFQILCPSTSIRTEGYSRIVEASNNNITFYQERRLQKLIDYAKNAGISSEKLTYFCSDLQKLLNAKQRAAAHYTSVKVIFKNRNRVQIKRLLKYNQEDIVARKNWRFSCCQDIQLHASSYCWEYSGWFNSPVAGITPFSNLSAAPSSYTTIFYYLPHVDLVVEQILDGLNNLILYLLESQGFMSLNEVHESISSQLAPYAETSKFSINEIDLRLRRFVSRGVVTLNK